MRRNYAQTFCAGTSHHVYRGETSAVNKARIGIQNLYIVFFIFIYLFIYLFIFILFILFFFAYNRLCLRFNTLQIDFNYYFY